jgi:ubiquinone/menaquinone biosynthesis C-methylase UbiE
MEDIINSVTLIRIRIKTRYEPGRIRIMRNSKKVAAHEFGRRSKAYATSSTLIDQTDLDTVVRLLNLSGNEIVLDVATGTGNLAMALSPHVKRVVGLDITPGMLEMAVQAAQERGIDNISNHGGDVEHLPFRDSSFNVVACRFSFHHFPEPIKSISEMARVLKTGGKLVIEDMVTSQDQAKSEYQNTLEYLRDPSHIRHYQISELKQMLRDEGLDILDIVNGGTDFDFNHWIGIADPPAKNVRRIWDMMMDSMDGDLSGLNVRWDDDRLVFRYTTVIMVVIKR